MKAEYQGCEGLWRTARLRGLVLNFSVSTQTNLTVAAWLADLCRGGRRVILGHERSQVLDGVMIFKIGMPSTLLVLHENFRIHVGPVEKVKGGAAQAMCFAEQLVVTFKCQVQTCRGLIGNPRIIHCCTLCIDPFLFMRLILLSAVLIGQPWSTQKNRFQERDLQRGSFTGFAN